MEGKTVYFKEGYVPYYTIVFFYTPATLGYYRLPTSWKLKSHELHKLFSPHEIVKISNEHKKSQQSNKLLFY